MPSLPKRRPLSWRPGVTVGTPGGRVGWVARKFFPKAATRLYLGWIRLTRLPATRRVIRQCLRTDPPPWFDHVEIETLNRCNGGCAFCPVNRHSDSRPYQRMPESLFDRILEQLASIGYAGTFGLFSNNEPLLDTRLEFFAARARAALPDAAIYCSTNGTLLDVDRLRRLLPSLDRLVVNNYHDQPVLREEIRALYEFCRGCEGERLLAGKSVQINLRKTEDVLTSRAGNAPNRTPPAAPISMPCSLPFTQLIVRPDGKVSLCCNDALGEMTLGDFTRQEVGEIWHGEACRSVRQRLHDHGRAGLPLCRRCDFIKHDIA